MHSKNFTLMAGIESLSESLLLNASLKYEISFNKMKFTPKLGLGIMPFIIFNIPNNNFGLKISYEVSKALDFFIEPKISFLWQY